MTAPTPSRPGFPKDALRRYGFLYLLALSLAFGIKYWYRSAGCRELDWILAPTARWVQAISGISFEKVPQLGYVNHSLRFIIAPSCSGVQFMVIAFSSLCFPFLHRTGKIRKGCCWIAFALAASYLYAIAANGLRIVLSIYLPGLLAKNGMGFFLSGWLTPKRLHTSIGTAVYFTSLLFLYRGTERLFRKTAPTDSGLPCSPIRYAVLRFAPPICCYFAFVLGIPFLLRIFRNDWDNFTDYALLITSTCLAALLCLCLTGFLCKRLRRKRL